MARGRRPKRGVEPEPSHGNIDEENDDELLAQALRQSQEDFEKAETLKKKEDEELRRAINASLMPNEAEANDGGWQLQLEDDTPPIVEQNGASSSSHDLPESSGLIKTSTPLKPFDDLNLDDLIDSAPCDPVDDPKSKVTENVVTEAQNLDRPETSRDQSIDPPETSRSQSIDPPENSRRGQNLAPPENTNVTDSPAARRTRSRTRKKQQQQKTSPTTVINNNVTNNVNNVTVNNAEPSPGIISTVVETVTNYVKNNLNNLMGTLSQNISTDDAQVRRISGRATRSASGANPGEIHGSSENVRNPSSFLEPGPSTSQVPGTRSRSASARTRSGRRAATQNGLSGQGNPNVQVGQNGFSGPGNRLGQGNSNVPVGQNGFSGQGNRLGHGNQNVQAGQNGFSGPGNRLGRGNPSSQVANFQAGNAQNGVVQDVQFSNAQDVNAQDANNQDASAQDGNNQNANVQDANNQDANAQATNNGQMLITNYAQPSATASQASTRTATTSGNTVNGRGRGRGRGKGRGRGRGSGYGTGASSGTSSNPDPFIIPSTAFEGYEEVVSSSGYVSGKRNRKKIDYGSDSDDDHETSALEDLAASFTEAVTLQTVYRATANDSQFATRFWDIDGHFNSIVNGMSTMQSIVTCNNPELEVKYQQKRDSFEVLEIPTTELILYYNSYSGNSQSVLWNIVKRHFKPFRNHDGRTEFGKGVYLYERPDLARAKDQGIVVCKVLIGHHQRITKPDKEPIAKGHHSKKVDIKNNKFYVISNQDQILPWAVIHCDDPDQGQPSNNAANRGFDPEAERDKINKQMAKIFEKSLKLHLTGQYMKPSTAIKTRLYPHQMYALAWMCNRENAKDIGVRGGILADDMGLGKTLTVLSLIMTNFHDKRPLQKPVFGRIRRLTKETLRYMPQGSMKNNGPQSDALGARVKVRSFGKKDNRGRAKNSKRKHEEEAFFITNEAESVDREVLEDSQLVDDEKDEFDCLIDGKASYSERLGLDSSTDFFDNACKKRKIYNDDLSDDEEYQNMTEEERNERMAPKLNVDGAVEMSEDESTICACQGLEGCECVRNEVISGMTFEASDVTTMSSMQNAHKNDKMIFPGLNLDGNVEDSEDEEIVSSSSNRKAKKLRIKEDSDEEADPEIGRSASPDSEFDDDIPDFDMSNLNNTNGDDTNDNENLDFQLTEQQRKNLITPPIMPAKLNGRRRATLIVTPASLIGHWLEQIERHVDKSTDLSIFVHHGANKTMLATELQDQDIVLTTYGTLQSELNDFNMGPLLKAKWLRVCLDEGHNIKNHLSKTAKAALNLDTKRKWIISGTPIQNNLNELWSLLLWLDEPTYGSDRPKFKKQIDQPVKNGDLRGVYRLQFLIEAICLRRTKQDEIAPGRPLVTLPPKTITLKELEFSREERIVYDAYHNHAKKIIERYMKKKTLLKNYAHVFAIMMRLRQLCCHRDLLPITWQEVNLEDIEDIARDAIRGDEEESQEDSERAKELAERLRDMIKDGISDECSICLTEFDHPVITPCAHVYCRPCIVQLIETHAHPPAPCPLCRGPLEIRGLLEAAQNDEEEEKESNKSFEDIIVDVSSTKINAVMEHVRMIRQRTPEDKTIIVSQFTSLLSILQPLLNDSGIRFVRLDGTMSTRKRSEVIADFQDTARDSPTVMLLSLRAGGVGLNLNVANHLLLLDPAWNPSTEDQCFDRIHRLGQTKEVEIIRFVMKHSIEIKMLDIQERKKNLIMGAFRQTEAERRERRLQDIRDLFEITTA